MRDFDVVKIWSNMFFFESKIYNQMEGVSTEYEIISTGNIALCLITENPV